MLESLFNDVAGLKIRKFIKKRLHYRGFPVEFANFLRTPILKKICERLLPNRGESHSYKNSCDSYQHYIADQRTF